MILKYKLVGICGPSGEAMVREEDVASYLKQEGYSLADVEKKEEEAPVEEEKKEEVVEEVKDEYTLEELGGFTKARLAALARHLGVSDKGKKRTLIVAIAESYGEGFLDQMSVSDLEDFVKENRLDIDLSQFDSIEEKREATKLAFK